jgi:hypothetical protein
MPAITRNLNLVFTRIFAVRTAEFLAFRHQAIARRMGAFLGRFSHRSFSLREI